jgi:predicted esterase
MDRKWQIGGVLALTLVVPAALAQTRAPERAVTRPDGTVVYPRAEEAQPRGSSWWQRDRDVGADERERRRVEAQQSAVDRQEQQTRERDAAYANPARQIAPTAGR